MATIRLQRFGRFLYPADAISERVLEDGVGVGKIPCDKFYSYSPRIVKKGHRMAIIGETNDIV